MKLTDIIPFIGKNQIKGSTDIDLTGIQMDSRKVKPGNIFVAVKGTQTDGHAYIGKAIEQGAKAILCEKIPEQQFPEITFIQVADSEDAVGKAATAFYGNPSQKLKLIGVTGTNGKTTVATLLYKLFGYFGYRCGLCSTVCNYIGDQAIPADHTTPDPITLNALLARMVETGCEYAFMETSSHAIHQKRIGGLTFAGGIFTNLTRDHLDYHKTFENYRDAKKKFFDDLSPSAFALTNADDRNGTFMVQNTRATVRTYSTRSLADFKARILEMSFEGMYLNIDGHEVSVPFVGKFNVSNLLAVYGTARMLGREPEEILTGLSTLHSVAGRFEALRSPNGFNAIVDYAHTPDALTNVLNAIHEVLNGKGEVITVCGAGGNRDKGKRPLMAQEAAKRSDRLVITSDNPRYEDPQDIIKDMLAGLDTEQRQRTLTITDRREAIRAACMMAKPGDVVLVAGKGHEDYQEICGVKHHFNDKEVLQDIFATLKN